MSDVAASYLLHARSARRLAQRILRDAAEAEDVVQDAFLHLFSRDTMPTPDRATERGHVLVLVHSRAVDRLRRRHSADRAIARASHEPAPAPAPSTQRFAREAGRLRSALQGLRPCEREVIELAYSSGLSHTEIAKSSGLPLGTVKARLRLGLRQLAKMLSADSFKPCAGGRR